MNKERAIFYGGMAILSSVMAAGVIYSAIHVDYPRTQASLSSIKNMDHCGKRVISELVKSTRHLATNSEVSAAKQLCADVAQDRGLLVRAKQTGGSPYLLNAYTAAIAAGTPKGIATAIVHFDPNGLVHHVHSFHLIVPPHKYRTPYSMYSPEAISVRSKHNANLQVEE